MEYFRINFFIFSFVTVSEIKNIHGGGGLEISVEKGYLNSAPGNQLTERLCQWSYLCNGEYTYEIGNTLKILCCNDDSRSRLEWRDVKNKMTLISKRSNFILVTLTDLDRDDDNSEFICESNGSNETISLRLQLSRDSLKNFKNYEASKAIKVNDKDLEKCRNDIKSQLTDPDTTTIKCYYIQNTTIPPYHPVRYKTIYKKEKVEGKIWKLKENIEEASFLKNNTKNFNETFEEPESLSIPLVIGVGVTGAVSGIIMSILLYCFYKRYKARKITNECYSEPVHYAEIQTSPIVTTVPLREETPYAQIVGVLTRR